jgi:predicted metal-dependent hydrolase
MAPMTLLDYVIAHELCHLVERNHSGRFWRALEVLMPDFDRLPRKKSSEPGILLRHFRTGEPF